MDYKILINKNAVPVLIEASNNADPDTWFALEDESHHIRFKEEPTEVLKDIFGLMNFAPQSLVSAELENQRGQTFPLPTGYKVSFEEEQYIGSESETSFTIGYRKVAILSKLEEPCKHTITNGRKGETASFCVDCGIKVLDVETRPCKDCANYKRLSDGSICKKLLMAVVPDMLATFNVDKGTCFEVVAPSEEVKLDIKCPFCNEDGFDKIGLKNHLENHCKEYETTERI